VGALQEVKKKNTTLPLHAFTPHHLFRGHHWAFRRVESCCRRNQLSDFQL